MYPLWAPSSIQKVSTSGKTQILHSARSPPIRYWIDIHSSYNTCVSPVHTHAYAFLYPSFSRIQSRWRRHDPASSWTNAFKRFIENGRLGSACNARTTYDLRTHTHIGFFRIPTMTRRSSHNGALGKGVLLAPKRGADVSEGRVTVVPQVVRAHMLWARPLSRLWLSRLRTGRGRGLAGGSADARTRGRRWARERVPAARGRP